MDELLQLSAQIPPFAALLALLIPLAVAVAWYGSRRARFGGGAAATRRFGGRSASPLDPAFMAAVRRFEERGAAAEIARAPAGLVMLRGAISGAATTLGGAPGRECVWRNRADGRRDMAVASEIVFIRDASGQASLEGLEGAQVIAPREHVGPNLEWVSLYIGDEIEVIGRFDLEPAPIGDAPSAQIYGSLGLDGKLHVRVLRRPSPPEAAEPPEEGPRAAAAPPPNPEPNQEPTRESP